MISWSSNPGPRDPVADVAQVLESGLGARQAYLHGLDAHGPQVAEALVGEVVRTLVADAEFHPAALATTRFGARAPGGVSPDFGVWSQRAVIR